MFECPVCGRQLGKGEMHPGTFACPACKTKLDLPDIGRLESTMMAVVGLVASIVATYLLGAGTYFFPFAVLLTCFVVGPVVGVAWVLIRVVVLPPKLRRHVPSWPDEGTILHITSPPEPPKES